MNILKSYWRTILLIFIILFLSLMNVNKMLPNEIHLYRHFDKFVHFIMYFSLSFVFFIENYIYKNFIRKIWIITNTITFGIFIEYLQYLITNYRTGNVYDAIFNTLGVISGSILFAFVKDYPIIYKIMLFKNNYKR